MSKPPVPRMHLVGPLNLDPSLYPSVAEAAIAGGCDAVHVRMPGGATREVVWMARSIREVSRGATMIVNDRIDIALLVGADGVHLGEQGFTVAEARRLVPESMLIGRSIHDLDGAKSAADDGADYLLAGHIFETPSKDGMPGRGLDWLTRIVAAVDLPVIAIGGITSDRIASVIATGAHGVALGRELLLSDNVAERADEAQTQIGRHERGRQHAGHRDRDDHH